LGTSLLKVKTLFLVGWREQNSTISFAGFIFLDFNVNFYSPTQFLNK